MTERIIDHNFTRITKMTDKRPTLKEAQAIVGGLVQFVELLPELTEDQPMQMLVNEEGILLQLGYNETASLMTGQHIFGPALVLTGQAMWD